MTAEATKNNNIGKNANVSPWPEQDGNPVVFLLDARDEFDAQLLTSWIDRHRPDADRHCTIIRLSNDGIDASLADRINDAPDDAWLQPVRIAWLRS